jgi:alcohol dehydrogenase class IV
MSQNFSYDFLAPQRIVFGWGRRREAGKFGKTLGRRAFVIYGFAEERAVAMCEEIMASLRVEAIEPVFLARLRHEPEVADVDRVAADLRSRSAGPGDFMLAIGGGAAIDLAKAAAAMAVNRESETVKDHLENVGRDLKIVESPLPVMAMPTTAGAGAEATKNAVISSYEPAFKKSLRDDRLLPRIALVDPELTVSVSAKTTAASGMDAITQLIESYVSRKAQPIPQALALQGLELAVPAIVEAVQNGKSRAAREAMSHAALLSGICLANAGLGMAHGVAPAMGTVCRVPHGVACALMLPVAIRVNLECRLGDYARLGKLVFGHSGEDLGEAAGAFLHGIETLCDRVGVPRRLSEVGVKREDIPALVKGSRGSSMSGNPRDLSDSELTAILEGLL